ncbi:MAG: ornithine cyclodeaminase family protein [Alphaproteobacteria bacterium]|nr:ornithine cyclodeaminase family protein [Alphaproteobacteria bacterium]
MRTVSPEDITARIDIAALLPVMRDALRAEAEGRVEVPLRAGWSLKNDFGMLAMPARSEELKLAAFKFLTLVDGNRALGIPGVMGELTVLNAVTGAPIARLPAEEVTLLRTAACSAVATDLLALPDADSVALFGSGPQAAHHVEAMLAVRPIKRVLVTGRDHERAEKLAGEVRHRFGIEAVAGPDPARLRDAAIVCTVTNAREALFEAEDVHPQAHINAIGAYRPDMCELPAPLVRDAAIFADSKIPVAREAGDLLAAFGSPEAVAAHLRAIGELIATPLPKRPTGRTIYKAVGNAGQDLYAAAAILQLLSD